MQTFSSRELSKNSELRLKCFRWLCASKLIVSAICMFVEFYTFKMFAKNIKIEAFFTFCSKKNENLQTRFVNVTKIWSGPSKIKKGSDHTQPDCLCRKSSCLQNYKSILHRYGSSKWFHQKIFSVSKVTCCQKNKIEKCVPSIFNLFSFLCVMWVCHHFLSFSTFHQCVLLMLNTL